MPELPNFRSQLSEPLTRTSLGLMASTLLSGVLGVGFWALAARMFSVTTVGRDGVLVAALLALSGIGQLNLHNVFPRFLPQIRGRRGQYVIAGYVCASLASLILGLLFVYVAPLTSQSFTFLAGDVTVAILFPIAVAAWSVFCLQDAVLTALGRAAWLPVENGLFSLARVVLLLVVPLLVSGHGVLLAYVIPMFVAVPIVNWFIAKRAMPYASPPPPRSEHSLDIGSRRFLTFLATDFCGTVLAQMAMTAMPLLVVALMGAEASAYFLIPFMLITAFDAMFLAVTMSLTTEAARAPARAGELTKRSLRWLLAVQLPATGVIIFAAPIILAPYGGAYVHHGVTLLRMLAIASSLRAVVFLYSSAARLQGHGGRLLCVQFAAAVSIIGGVAALAPPLGLTGVGLAWLATWGALALAVAIPLYRFTRSPQIWGASNDHERGATVLNTDLAAAATVPA